MNRIAIARVMWCTVATWVVMPAHAAESSATRNKSTTQHGTTVRLLSPSNVAASSQKVLHGLVVPKQQVVISAPLNGMLMSLSAEEGQLVERGQVLAQMDYRAAKAAMEVARLRAINDASVRHAAYALRHATLQLNSITRAHGAGAGTDYELRQATLRRDQAEAFHSMEMNKQARARAALKFEEQKYERHIVRAPFAGRVVRLFSQPGTRLRVSEPLLRIVAMQILQVNVQIPVNLFDTVRAGQEYRLIADEPVGRPLTGTLTVVDPMIDSTTGTFRGVFTIANDDESLPAGFAVKLDTQRLSQKPAAASTETH